MSTLVEEFYCLNKAPFTPQRDTGPVLMTESLRSAANFLRQGLGEQTPVLSIVGGAGIGKSSLVRALPKVVGKEYKVAQISGRAKSWGDFGPTFVKTFYLDIDRLTREDLEAAHDRVGKPLIVVDDAQHLPASLLERICILPQLRTTYGEPVVQVILFADLDSVPTEDVRPLLAWVEADARHMMEPVPLSDAHSFIDTCLRRAGWEGQPLVCEAGAAAIHRHSLGNPRRLGEACMDVLEQGATRGLKLIDAEFVVECLSATRTLKLGEPLLVAPGTPICEEPTHTVAEVNGDFPFAAIPLTAENINESESLMLEDEELEAEYKVLGYPTGCPVSVGHETMSSVVRSASGARMPTLRPRVRAHGRPSYVAWFCVVAAALALYAARTEVEDLFHQLGFSLPFTAQTVGAVETTPTSLKDALSLGGEPKATSVTIPVPNESSDQALAALRIAPLVDTAALAKN